MIVSFLDFHTQSYFHSILLASFQFFLFIPHYELSRHPDIARTGLLQWFEVCQRLQLQPIPVQELRFWQCFVAHSVMPTISRRPGNVSSAGPQKLLNHSSDFFSLDWRVTKDSCSESSGCVGVMAMFMGKYNASTYDHKVVRRNTDIGGWKRQMSSQRMRCPSYFDHECTQDMPLLRCEKKQIYIRFLLALVRRSRDGDCFEALDLCCEVCPVLHFISSDAEHW